MAELIVPKAQPTIQPVEDLHIHVTARIPEAFEVHPLTIWGEWSDMQAERLEEALIASLPGGIYDRLVGRMLARKASHFRVAWDPGTVAQRPANDPTTRRDAGMLRLVAQMVHRVYHTDRAGTWRECPSDICASIAHHLGEQEPRK